MANDRTSPACRGAIWIELPAAPLLDDARARLGAELAVRLGDPALAHSSLSSVRALKLTDAGKATIAAELAHTAELVGQE